MEYLMTYGWAILIIAVVLGALYQMGAFNSSSLTVRVPPGACQVLRTSAAVNLVGQCSGILPKYVAQFDGQSSMVKVTDTSSLDTAGQSLSISVWFSASSSSLSPSGNPSLLSHLSGCVINGFLLGIRNGQVWVVQGGGSDVYLSTPVLLPNTWYNLVFTWQNTGSSTSTETIYANGQQAYTRSMANGVPGAINNPVYFGSTPNNCGWSSTLYFSGSEENVQIYNTSLDASSIATLYQEGIGGAPVNPQYLVGWWPLNGDTKDYSSNNNNGAPTSLTYTAQYGK
jgi:hypothetical protein